MKTVIFRKSCLFNRITLNCLIITLLSFNFGCTGSPKKNDSKAEINASASTAFDNDGAKHFAAFDSLDSTYLAGGSSERPLAEYYERRQYPGSPPYIPHPIETGFGQDDNCLSCHSKGGWVVKWKRNTPVTPHPEQINCSQCHLKISTTDLFQVSDWKSVEPPRLGSSQLPGSPPPIPHSLQMRGNCVACHIGPGAVTPIKVDHFSRGNCRQCHVNMNTMALFKR